MINIWHARFYTLAQTIAKWSKDSDSQVGAVLVSPDRRNITVGYNGFPVKIADTDARLKDKELKRKLMIHAELNALHNAKVQVQGFTMYITKPPCSQCALSIVQARIATVVIPRLEANSNWLAEQNLALELLREAQIHIEWIK